MTDQRKTKTQLLEELNGLRRRVQELETSEKAIREDCQIYRNIFDLAPHLATITRMKDGRYLQVNEAFYRLTGYNAEETIGRTPFDLNLYVDPIDRLRILEALHNKDRVEGIEIKFRRKDGSVIDDLVSARPYRFQGEDCLLLMATEITSIRVLEESLRESEEKYRSIVENMEEGYYEVDLTGSYTFVNPAVCRYHGATREELIGLNNREFMSLETAKRVFELFNSVYRTGISSQTFEQDVEIIRKDGTICPLQLSVSLIRDASGEAVGFRGITYDATERKKLLAERERYREFVENVDEGCFENDLGGNFTFVNEVACRRFGLSREELLGRNNRDYTAPETAKKAFQVYNEIYRTGIPANIFDYEIIDREGIRRFMDMSVSLMRDATGKPIGFRGTSRDVTERKAMEAEKERLTEQLSQARKLEAIGTLAGGLAHDFNNLLMGIQGHASLIMLDLNSAHPHYERLKAIESQVKIGAELTRQLLGYAQGGRFEMVSTNLNELLSKASVLFGRMKKNIRIHHHFSQPLRLVEADSAQIEQVFLSLFMNASEVMPGGGTLFLETANVELDESVAQPNEVVPGPYIKISVTDTGWGMDEKTRARIFEPFFTTREMGRGVGLGLAPVYGIIKGHGGLIEVFSEKGEGTTFHIYLPTRPEKAPLLDPPALEPPVRLGTILLVDDEDVIIEVVGAMLAGLKYEVRIARNGEQAVEIFRDNQGQIDLVIMDMVMPGIGGGEAIDIIKKINPRTKVILASGYSLEGEAKEILERGGADLFLQKPFQLQDLSSKIRQVLEVG